MKMWRQDIYWIDFPYTRLEWIQGLHTRAGEIHSDSLQVAQNVHKVGREEITELIQAEVSKAE